MSIDTQKQMDLMSAMLWVLYDASPVVGLGALQKRDDLDQHSLFEAMRDLIRTREDGGIELGTDYVFGRMVKTLIRVDKRGGLYLSPENPNPDWQGWARRYPTTGEARRAATRMRDDSKLKEMDPNGSTSHKLLYEAPPEAIEQLEKIHNMIEAVATKYNVPVAYRYQRSLYHVVDEDGDVIGESGSSGHVYYNTSMITSSFQLGLMADQTDEDEADMPIQLRMLYSSLLQAVVEKREDELREQASEN